MQPDLETMKPANNIQPDFTPADGDSDIPAGIDAFLRELARWTVEDMHKTTALGQEAIQDGKAFENPDDTAEFDQEPLLKKIS